MWRGTSKKIFSAVLVIGFVVGGCSDDNDAAEYQYGPGESGGTYTPPAGASPVLELVAGQQQTLQFGQEVDLAVRYVDDNTQNGIAGAPIDYAIVGESGGATLAALRTHTDASGFAQVSLTAGQQNASVTVEVSPPAGGGEPISFQVVVDDQPIGSVSASATYLGELPLENLMPALHRGVSCADLDPEALPAPWMPADAPLASLEDTAAWAGVEVGTDYAVTVTGQVGPNIRAFGCVDAVGVVQSETSDVRVALADVDWPGPVLGTYDLVNQLDFGGKLPGSARSVVDLLDELTDDQDIDCNTATEDYGQDPGAFLTDFVMRQTCHWECLPGEDYDSCSEIDHGMGDIGALCEHNMMVWEGGQSSIFGGCGAWEVGAPWVQDQINGYVAQHFPSGVLAFAEMAGDLSRAINKAKIYSELNVQEGSDTSQPLMHRLVDMEVLLHDAQGQEHVYRFAMAEAGVTSLQSYGALTVDGNEVTIPDHEFNLSYGKLVHYVYVHGLLPLFGYESTAQMFETWVDCAAVGQGLHAQLPYVPLTAQGWQSVCEMGVQLAADTFESELTEAISAEGTLRLGGTCTASDIDPVSNTAAALSDGIWSGTWGEDSQTGNVSGTFVGSAR